MARPGFLRHIESDSGTLSGGSWSATLPLANIRDQDVQKVARTTSAALGATTWRIDFGTTVTRWIDLFLILGHNMTTAATVRFVLTNSADDSTARLYNQLVNAWRPVVVFGANPFGGFGWDGTSYPEGYVSPPEVRHRTPAVQMVGAGGARYLFVYITDAANPAGHIDVGRFLAGPFWSPEVGAAFGAEIRIVDPSPSRRTSGGRRVAGDLPRYREMHARLEYLTRTEAMGFIYEWARLGKRKDVYFTFDADETDEIGSRRSIYGALQNPPSLVHGAGLRVAVDFVLEELI